MSSFWPAPRAICPLAARVSVPGSKSLSNRHLVLAALATAPSQIQGLLRARDTELMAQGLRMLGCAVELDGDRALVTPGPLHGNGTIDCGLAGTVMRFLPPLAALADGPVTFDGDPAARARPMATMLTALRGLGVQIQAADDCLPFTVQGQGGIAGGQLTIDAAASSQFVSGLLLAAPRFTRGLRLHHCGDRLPSAPHIEMTLSVLRDSGVRAQSLDERTWQVDPGPIAAQDVHIEPDLSNAAPFLAAALVAGGWVEIPGWPTESTQPGMLLPELLTAFGARAERRGSTLRISGSGRVMAVDLDLRQAGELTPTMAALATLAPGRSHLRGIGHLRGHETDRLAALEREIRRLGAQAQAGPDDLTIIGPATRGADIHTYADHRMATFAAIVGLRLAVGIEDVATTAKTLPDFTERWTRMVSA